MPKRATTTAIVLAGLFCGPALADGPYGAVALDPKTGFVAFSDSANTADEAMATAMSLCEKNGANCTESHGVHNGCAALARSSDDETYGISIHDTRQAAQDGAIKACADNGGSGCNIHDTYCSPKGLDE